MEKGTKFAIATILCAIAVAGAVLTVPAYVAPVGAFTESDAMLHGGQCAYVDKIGEGQGILIGCAPNTVTNTLKNMTRDMLMDGNHSLLLCDVTPDHIQLSLETSAVNATVATCGQIVSSNGLDIAAGTVTLDTTNVANYSVTKKFEATGTQANIAKVCLHNDSATDGALMASSLLASTIDLVANENLTIVYYLGLT